MNLICGINPVLEALHSGQRHFDRLLVVKGLRNRRIAEAIAQASRLGIPLRFESRETLDRLAGGVPHQGLIALVSPKPLLDVEDLLAHAHEPALLVVLDGVEDPRNLGAILRTCEAAGADGVLLPQRHSAGLSETVARASAGALEHVRVARIGNVVQALDALKQRGVWVVGFDAGGSERWDAVDLRRPVALVLGGEGRGIRRLVRERCDHLVSLPLFGHVASLNVSVAAGIALYEVIRQRGSVPSHVRPIPSRPAAPAFAIVGPAPEDAEHDPGRIGPAPLAPSEAADDGDDEQSCEVVRLHDDEEAAWAGPTILRAKARPHGGWQQRPERRRRKGRGAPGAPSPPLERDQPPAAEGGPEGAALLRHEGRGRRRRRKGRRIEGQGGSQAGSPPAERPSSQPGPESPAASSGPPDGSRSLPAGGSRRRRRRRRRPAGPA